MSAAVVAHATRTWQSDSIEREWRAKPSGRALGWRPKETVAGASCSCGWSKYAADRVEARRLARQHRTLTAVQVGDVVIYQGSMQSERGNRFLVSAVDDERFTLVDDYMGDTMLRNVRFVSIERSGMPRVEMCGECGHRSDEAIPALHGQCMAYGCGCCAHQAGVSL